MNPGKGGATIFAEALRLPAEERSDYLGQATSGNHNCHIGFSLVAAIAEHIGQSFGSRARYFWIIPVVVSSE
jgi:hypothetical protein